MSPPTLGNGSEPGGATCAQCHNAAPESLPTVVGVARRSLIERAGTSEKLDRLVSRPCCRKRLAAADAARPGSSDRYLWEAAAGLDQPGRWLRAVRPGLESLVAMTGLEVRAFELADKLVRAARHAPRGRRVEVIFGDILAAEILAATTPAAVGTASAPRLSQADVLKAGYARRDRLQRVLMRELGPALAPLAFYDVLTRATQGARHGRPGKTADELLADAAKWVTNYHRHSQLPRAVARPLGRDATPEQRADSEQIAAEAMLKASLRFDSDRDVLYSTWVWPAMRGRVIDALRREAKLANRINRLDGDVENHPRAADDDGLVQALEELERDAIGPCLLWLTKAEIKAVDLRLSALRAGMNHLDMLDLDGVDRGAHKTAFSSAVVGIKVNLVEELTVGERVDLLAAIGNRNRSRWMRTRAHLTPAQIERELQHGEHAPPFIGRIRRGALAWRDHEVVVLVSRYAG